MTERRNWKCNKCFRLRAYCYEQGFSTTVQGLFYVVLLWWCFGLIYDLGGAAYLAARLRSATMLAAQDGAKELDLVEFYRTDGVQIAAGNAITCACGIRQTDDGHRKRGRRVRAVWRTARLRRG